MFAARMSSDTSEGIATVVQRARTVDSLRDAFRDSPSRLAERQNMDLLRSARRRASALATVAVAAGALAACAGGSGSSADASASGSSSGGSAAGGKPVTITFWSWVPGIEKTVALWNAENRDVQVKFTRIAAADQAKLSTAVDAGTGPDVGTISQHLLPDFVINGRALDITTQVGGAKDQFTPASWNVSSLGGKVYAVPQDTGPLALFYRKDFFTKNKINVPKTWDEFRTAATQVRQADPQASIAAFTPNEPSIWYSLLWQKQGTWFGIDGDSWKVSLNGPESRQLADYWQGLIDGGLVSQEQMFGPGYWAALKSGKVVTIPYAAWFAKLIETNVPSLKGKWAVAPLPRWSGSDTSGDTGGAVNPVLKGSKNVDAAARFALWLNTDPKSLNILTTEGGLFPASKPGLSSPAMSAKSPYYGGQAVYQVFKDEALRVPPTWTEGPTFNQITTDLTDALGRVGAKKSTLNAELDALQTKTVERLKSQGLKVQSAS
jgi:multiple sugar transport system substrate-binding protein